jgi:hypothetical protein
MAVNHNKNKVVQRYSPSHSSSQRRSAPLVAWTSYIDGQGPEIKWPLAVPGNSGIPILGIDALLYQLSLGNQRSLLQKNRDVAENVNTYESLLANIFGIESYELKEMMMMAFKR